jgi:hypothetical protein
MEEPNILVKTALNEAVQKVNEGMRPTEALKKVASDLDLNPNYIQRTGEALNVALHYKHFKTASDRSADFEIADIPKVIEDVFTLNDKTASERISEQFSTFDSNESVFNYNRMLSNPVYKQAFLEISGASATEESYPVTFRTAYEKAANYVQKLDKQAEAAEVEKIAAELELSNNFSNLCDHFKKDAGYRTSFEEFESQVFSKHGSSAIPYLDFIHKTAAPHEERGVHDTGYIMFEPCKESFLFDNLLKAAEAFDVAEKTASETAENLKYESAYLKECHKLMGKKAEPMDAETDYSSVASEDSSKEEYKDSEDPVLAEIKKKASDSNYKIAAEYEKDPVLAQALEKEAFFGGLTSMLGLGNIMAGPVHEMASEQVSEAFSGGFKHSEKGGHKPNLTLDNMERKLLLQELMLTDPILSKVNPQKVARAFEQLLRLSPEISKEKEVVRAELRAMVASQALSKYDADLMTKLDVGMMKRRLAAHEFNAGHSDNFRF